MLPDALGSINIAKIQAPEHNESVVDDAINDEGEITIIRLKKNAQILMKVKMRKLMIIE